MVWRIILLILAIAVASIWSPNPAVAMNSGCTQTEINAGFCSSVSAGLGDEDVTLGVGFIQPGSPPSSGGGGSDRNADTGGNSGPLIELGCQFPVLVDRCQGFGPGRSVPAVPAAPPAQPVTLTDIASFRPTADTAGMEPKGWMIVGLDTNFFSGSAAQVVDGVLLGQAASVRFTPVGWRWNYGDGTTATVSTAGASWETLGVPEFSATLSSHIYSSSGTYVIDLTVLYAAEYRFGAGGWSPIAGTLGVPANRLTATAGSARTVLVERECMIDPRGPGC